MKVREFPHPPSGGLYAWKNDNGIDPRRFDLIARATGPHPRDMDPDAGLGSCYTYHVLDGEVVKGEIITNDVVDPCERRKAYLVVESSPFSQPR